MQARIEGDRSDDVKGVVVPVRGMPQSAAHCDAHGLRGETEQSRVLRQAGVDGCGQVGDRRGVGQTGQCSDNVVEGFVGFQEEVPGDHHL